ncbi:uncharacterized protein VTP21DRAFT_9288 [Calcarisporiella thermophila]|uniref:uncharacterized protein n=1 Tax=Calcarisporiella thermophila TaxID=911321 RepID=UPI0037448DEC
MLHSLLFSLVRTLLLQCYPAYASYKAVQHNDLETLSPWLMYWIVVGLFGIAESVADLFVFWIPFYYEIKLLFILWLILPQTQGSVFLYRRVVEPYFTQHEHEIDKTLAEYQESARRKGADLGRKGLTALQRFAVESLVKGQHLVADQIAHQTFGSSIPPPSTEGPRFTEPQRSSRKYDPAPSGPSQNSSLDTVTSWAGWLASSAVTVTSAAVVASSTRVAEAARAVTTPRKSATSSKASAEEARKIRAEKRRELEAMLRELEDEESEDH